MNTTSIAVLTGAVVVLGKWSTTEQTDYVRLAIGTTVYVIGLSALSGSNERLGQLFAATVLFGALLKYAIPISKKAGLVS